MSFLKDMEKMVKPHHVVILLGVLIIGFALCQYSDKKTTSVSGYTNVNLPLQPALVQTKSGSSSNPTINSNTSASVSTNSPSNPIISSNCTQMPVLTPDQLLPIDNNSSWASLNPAQNNGLGSTNFLNASAQLKSINTVGSSLRNANLQVRSEPPNPQSKVSPWLNSTIEPDLMRQPFEIGCPCPGSSPL